MRRIYFLFIFSILMGSTILGAQTINTVAGGGPIYPLQALSAPIGSPQAVTVDASGNYYFASGRQVFKVDTTGELTLFAGNGFPCVPINPSPACGDGGPATSASFGQLAGLAVDQAGNVYIADRTAGRIRKVDTSGTITTFAGNGTFGYSGDGGPATSASFYLPNSVAVDPNTGNVYIADTNNNRIRVVDPSGTISTFAGNGAFCGAAPGPNACGDGGPAINAGLAFPRGVSVDPAGIVYIADTNASRVRAVLPGGVLIATVLGFGSPNCLNGPPCTDPSTGDDASLAAPQGVAGILGGIVGIADTGHGRIVTEGIDPAYLQPGPILDVIGNCFNEPQCFQAPLGGPIGIASAGGPIYISNPGSHQIEVTGGTIGGPISPVAGNGTVAYFGDGGQATLASFDSPPGVARDQAGNLYIPDPGDDVVREVSAATGDITTIAGIPGKAGFGGDGSPATSANLNNPTGVALDGAGNLYIADSGNGVVRKMDTSGTISTIAGNGLPCRAGQPLPNGGTGQWLGYCYTGDGGPATSAGLGDPQGIALDSAGNLYIADSGNNLVLEVSAATGNISTVAGDGTECQTILDAAPCYAGDGGPATSAALFHPTSVAVDSSGNVYIADSGNNRVRMVDATSGTITTFAGIGSAGYSGDGGLAASASLNNPSGVELDGTGNLYIADTANRRIREVDASTGAINTVAGNGTLGFSGDGGSPLNASLFGPHGVFVDSADGLWIADSGNHRIRSVGNTSAGNNVAAAPVDTSTGASPVTLTFSTVTQPGNVSLTTSTTGPSVPSGFQLGSPATYYMLTTSAVYSGSIQICINYSGVSYTDSSQLSIWHYDTASSTWTQLSTTIDTANTTACASTPSLSPFAIFEPAYAAEVQPPISADGTSVFQLNRGVVPIKFTLTLNGAQTCQLPAATISLNRVSSTVQGPIDGSAYLMPSDDGSNFRIDTNACQYVYNLGANSLGAGTYQVNISIGGAIVGSGVFGLD